MLKRFGFHSDEMLLALAVWLCSLPLIGLVVIPLFGLKVAGITALVLLFSLMAICWGVCGWQIIATRKQ